MIPNVLMNNRNPNICGIGGERVKGLNIKICKCLVSGQLNKYEYFNPLEIEGEQGKVGKI